MNMKKILKSMLLFAAVTTGAVGIVSCSDDNLPQADALFRPVITESGNIEHFLDGNLVPYMTIKWDNYTSANQYIVRIESIDGNDVQEIVTDKTDCEFDNLQYDQEYNVFLTAANTESGLKSKAFTLTTTTLDYPTSLKAINSTDIIDNAVRVTWDDVDYDLLRIVNDDDEELVKEVQVTEADNENGSIIVNGLDPKTTYRVLAYANDKYLGKKRFTTVASEDFGSDVVIDLRNLTPDESKKFITSAVIAEDIEQNPGQNITYVLQGGIEYTISDVKFPTCANRIKFVTGLTLAGNAKFVSSAAMTAVTGSEIAAIEFEKIDFYAGKGAEDVKACTDNKFGSKQVFNLADGIAATIGRISFKSCSMNYYRALVRAQDGSSNKKEFGEVVFDDCVMNGVGDQGIVTTSNKAGDSFGTVTFNNCTITNINVIADFRQNAAQNPVINFTNCTLSYAPLETGQMLNLGSTAITINVQKTLIGPAMKAKAPWQVGATGKMINASKATVNVESSYMTTYEWVAENIFEGIKDAKQTETELWKAPATGDFSIIGKLEETGIGDLRWQ